MDKPVLIVDNSASIRQMLSFTLKPTGYEVDGAADGKEGLDKAQNESYSLVFADQNMPNVNGPSLIRNLHNLAGYRNVPIPILTTESSDVMKRQGHSTDATGWLVKPLDPPKLLEVTRKALP